MRESADDNPSGTTDDELALLMGDEQAAVLALIQLLEAIKHAQSGALADFQRFVLGSDGKIVAVFSRGDESDTMTVEDDLSPVVGLLAAYLKALKA